MLGLMILLAAAPTLPVSGDFDQDGKADRAYLRQMQSGYDLVIERGAGGTEIIQSLRDGDVFLAPLAPGRYSAACAKGAGPAKAACDVAYLNLDRTALQFGTREASRAAVLWDEGRFHVVWLSD